VRSDGIDINPVEDGYVVYDPARDRVHHLNPVAALVLELCTGAYAPGDIAAELRGAFGPREPLDDHVGACLAQLRQEGLIQFTTNGPPSGS
jgi:PqqD family protein of HPr-rel-A system